MKTSMKIALAFMALVILCGAITTNREQAGVCCGNPVPDCPPMCSK